MRVTERRIHTLTIEQLLELMDRLNKDEKASLLQLKVFPTEPENCDEKCKTCSAWKIFVQEVVAEG